MFILLNFTLGFSRKLLMESLIFFFFFWNFNFEMSRNFWSNSWCFYIKLEDTSKMRKPYGLTESRIDFLKINVDKKLEI
jgi:hypothetical protein